MHSANKWSTIENSKPSSNYVTIGSAGSPTSISKTASKQQGRPEQNLFKSNLMSRYSSQEDLQTGIKGKLSLEEFDSSPKSIKGNSFKKNSFVHRKSNEHGQKQVSVQSQKSNEKAPSNFKILKKKTLNAHPNSQFAAQSASNSIKNSLIQNLNKQRGVKHLKQTSSTSSTDNIGGSTSLQAVKSQKYIPSFLKNSIMNKKKVNQPSVPFLDGVSIENFKVLRLLGQGKYGSVYMAKDKLTGFIVALKITEKRRVAEQKFLTQFIREMKIQAYLDHPNIAKVFGFFHDNSSFYSIMQLGQGGQLYDVIKNGIALSEQSTSFIISNLLEAISYLHKKKILHRDIKPQNIVLVHGNVKLCDFGWAVYKKGELRSTFCGTPLYLSPELLNGEKYDQKVDLWAIGILAFELHIGSSPFNIESHQDLLKIVTNEIEYPQNRHISRNFKDFISAVLKKDPKQRLNAQRLLNLKFITRYSQLQTCEQLCK